MPCACLYSCETTFGDDRTVGTPHYDRLMLKAGHRVPGLHDPHPAQLDHLRATRVPPRGLRAREPVHPTAVSRTMNRNR